MITSLDKAIVAGLSAIIFMANFFFGTDFGLTETQSSAISAIIVAVQPFLVYFFPNRGVVIDPHYSEKLQELGSLRRAQMAGVANHKRGPEPK